MNEQLSVFETNTHGVEERKKVNVYKYKLMAVKENNIPYGFDLKVSGPKDIPEYLRKIFEIEYLAEEILMLLTLDTKNNVTGAFEVSRGTLNSSIVHPREIFKRAIANNSASIIIGHNHPSGDATPSKQDIDITKRLVECGKILGIDVLDHIILGEKYYVSLKEKGLL